MAGKKTGLYLSPVAEEIVNEAAEMNNYERIKKMSVDEMAEFLNKIEYECQLACIHKNDCYGYMQEKFDCLKSIGQWLREDSDE